MISMVERMKARRVASTFLILATLVLGILIGTVIQKGVKGKEASRASADATPLAIPEPKQLSSAFSSIAKQSPHSRGRRRGQTPDDEDPFQDFFDRFFGGQGGQGSPFGGSPEGMRERSLGSG